jgi:predicted fused transcriptional regulator/phosphomethylpyrimidine kinase
VACLPNADHVDDVAGVPGRIFDVKGRATIPGDPEFGVSEHVASVLLAARRNGSDARAAVNLRYDPALVATLSEAGHEAVEFEAEAGVDQAVGDAVASKPDATVLYQTGGFGVEPIVYVLGEDVENVVERIRMLV